MGNAIKFTEEGSIDVSFSVSENNGDDLVLQGIVKDTGIGISDEKKGMIFQSFTQADDSITRKYGGTGLGLSIVKSLLIQMGGDISVQSPVDHNRGTAFTFSLKLKLPSKRTLPTSDTQLEKLAFKKDLHILIVDDNKTNLLVAKKMLKKLGAKVTTAETGREAIGIVQTNDYDMVLMDIQMPEMDGYETTVEIRKLNYKKPIVALSANAYSDHVQNSLNSGMNGHLHKPYNENQLYQIVSKFTEQ